MKAEITFEKGIATTNQSLSKNTIEIFLGNVYKGDKGEDGKSAYEAAVEGGFSGTEEQFNNVLSDAICLGEQDPSGVPVAPEVTADYANKALKDWDGNDLRKAMYMSGVLDYEEFSTSKEYAVGKVVSYMNKSYKFIAPHSAGAWDESQVEETSLKKETKIYQFEDSDGNKVAPLVPEKAVVDKDGVRLSEKLEVLDNSEYLRGFVSINNNTIDVIIKQINIFLPKATFNGKHVLLDRIGVREGDFYVGFRDKDTQKSIDSIYFGSTQDAGIVRYKAKRKLGGDNVYYLDITIDIDELKAKNVIKNISGVQPILFFSDETDIDFQDYKLYDEFNAFKQSQENVNEKQSQTNAALRNGNILTNKDFTEEVGLVRYNGTEGDSSAFRRTSLISVKPYDCLYIYTIAKALYNGNCGICFYDANGDFVSGKRLNTIAEYNENGEEKPFIIQVPQSCYGVKTCKVSSAPGIIIKSLSVSDEISKQISLQDLYSFVSLPRELMVFAFNDKVQNWKVSLYPEAIINDTYIDLILDESKECVLNQYNQIGDSKISERTKTITASAKGYRDYGFSLKIKDINVENAKNKNIRFMAMGSSNVQNGYAVHVAKLVNRLKVDLGDIDFKLIGTRNSESSVTDNYKGQEYTFNANEIFCEGYAGHALCNMLRHAIQSRCDSKSYPYLLGGKELWDSLGLGTKTRNGVKEREYKTWSKTKEQCLLVGKTCHGWYDADPTKELWNWICITCGMAGKSFEVDDNQYTFGNSYSSTDDEAQKAYIKYLCKHPKLNWYDYDVVQETNGQSALNFAKFISKYRTMTDDGERLYFNAQKGTTGVAGQSNKGYLEDGAETEYYIGSLISDTTKYDLCVPNFIMLTLGANDVNVYLPNLFTYKKAAEQTFEDIKLLTDIIKQSYPDINIGHGFYHYYGVLNPSRWSDVGIIKKLNVGSWYQNYHHELNRLQEVNIFDNQYDKATFAPIYYTQNVIGCTNYIGYDVNSEKSIIYDSYTDQLHAYQGGWNGTAVGALLWIWSNLI